MGGKAYFPGAFSKVNISNSRNSQRTIIGPFTERAGSKESRCYPVVRNSRMGEELADTYA